MIVNTHSKTFQFQSGSIKTLRTNTGCLSQKPFQFQSGSIKTRQSGFLFRKVEQFQFQSGSIKTISSFVKSVVGYVVSIPIWFD